MSNFELGDVKGRNVMIGDNNVLHAGGNGVASLDELARRMQEGTRSIGEMEAALADLRDELSRRQQRPERVKALLAVLGAGAQAVAAVAVGVDKVRETLGLAS
jgi:hypothetical protein